MLNKFEQGFELENQGEYEQALNLYEQLAEQGDSNAQWRLGEMYELGKGVEKNINKAIDMYKSSAEQGHSKAQAYLGAMYELGKEVTQNYAKAFELYQSSATQGYAFAQCCLGSFYEYGTKGVEQDLRKAFELYQAASNQGHFEGQVCLGRMYALGLGVERDFAKAIELYQLAANQGDSEGQWRLGAMYEYGNGVEKNLDKAIEWYRLSANQGDSDAQYLLGKMYYWGTGVEKNYQKAIEWYKKSADQNDSDAQWSLGRIYEFGYGVKKDLSLAADWYSKSAKNHNPIGQAALGAMYVFGKGVEINLSKAIELLTQAADQDYTPAQWFLGTMYTGIDGVEKNIDYAIDLFCKAANAGNKNAISLLGIAYEEEKKDFVQAKYWYEKGAEQNDADCIYYLASLYEKGLGVEPSLSKAIELYHKACEGEEDISAEAAYRLGYAYYDGWGVKQSLEKAKEYFELAYKNGYSCSYAIDMVKYELSNKEINKKSAQENGDNLMRQYAQQIIKKKNFFATLPTHVLKDLEKDFSDTWHLLNKKTKDSLVTAIIFYVQTYSYGPSMYGNIDFAPTINGICKALEIELGKILYTGYIKYLLDQNIAPGSFPKNRNFLKQVSGHEYTYRNPEDVSKFTLGNMKHVVGLDKESALEVQTLDNEGNHRQAKNTIDKTMIDYIRFVCKEEAFGTIEEERAITDYIVYFTQEIGSIADSLRNPAAHANIIKCEKAEVCGNYIIKVKKILMHFLEKIDESKLKELLKNNM